MAESFWPKTLGPECSPVQPPGMIPVLEPPTWSIHAVTYGWPIWASYSFWLVPGTFEPSKDVDPRIEEYLREHGH